MMQSENSAPRRMLSIEEVLELVRVTRSTLYRMERAGKFPQGRLIGEARRVYFEDEVTAWQRALPSVRAKPRGRHVKRGN